MPSAKKKSGLGKGLSALVSEAQYETGHTTDNTMIPIQEIHPNPNQPRTHFNEKELGELSESIQEHGVLQPLLVRKDAKGYEIIAGERRYQAATLAGLTELPVIIKDVDDAEMLTIALIENLQRSDLNPIEEAKGYNGPVIVIRADDDKLVDDESCKRYAGLYQVAEFVRVSGGGHNFATIPSRTACEQAIWKFIQDNL